MVFILSDEFIKDRNSSQASVDGGWLEVAVVDLSESSDLFTPPFVRSALHLQLS